MNGWTGSTSLPKRQKSRRPNKVSVSVSPPSIEEQEQDHTPYALHLGLSTPQGAAALHQVLGARVEIHTDGVAWSTWAEEGVTPRPAAEGELVHHWVNVRGRVGVRETREALTHARLITPTIRDIGPRSYITQQGDHEAFVRELPQMREED